MKKLFLLLVISIQFCCVSLAFSASFEETKRAAEQGQAEAQFSLGSMYYSGQDIPQDYQQARYWYEKAAAQNDSQAQYLLGLMYEDGKGGSSDWDKALEWYGRACAHGNQDGCDAYARLNR